MTEKKDHKYPVMFTVRLTLQQSKKLKTNAHNSGLTCSEYARERLTK